MPVWTPPGLYIKVLETCATKILLENSDPIILACEEGYTSVQALVAGTTKNKTQKKKNYDLFNDK